MDKLEMKNCDTQVLLKEIGDLRRSLFNLKLNILAGQEKNTSLLKKTRRNIACALTYLCLKQKKEQVHGKTISKNK